MEQSKSLYLDWEIVTKKNSKNNNETGFSVPKDGCMHNTDISEYMAHCDIKNVDDAESILANIMETPLED